MDQADKILYSRYVFTGLDDMPREASIAIKDNKILDIGSKKDIEACAGKNTKFYNYENEMIMAGFFDAHAHLMLGSLFTFFSVNLSHALSEEEAAQAVKKFAHTKDNHEWVIGYGWDHTVWADSIFPTKELLDSLIPDKPVVLFHAEGHYVWVNSKALEIANITADTPSPSHGEIKKDANGEPTGLLIEEAMAIVTDLALDLPKDKKVHMIDTFLEHSASLGVTSINDLSASHSMAKLDDFSIFKTFENNNALTTRINLYPMMDGDVEAIHQMCDEYNSEKLNLVGLKHFIDGVVTGHTAYMLDPYIDDPSNSGEPAINLETLKEWSIEADRIGLQIRFHTIGDRAVRTGLDIFEEAQQINGKKDLRHSLEHVEVIHPDDIPRFKELGVIASLQPIHLRLMPSTSHTTRVHEEKHPYIYPAKTLKNEGARLAFGTDFPVAPLNPMLGIYQSVTRMDYHGKHPFNEQEKLTLADTLRAYTIYSAYDTHRDTLVGTLEPGKLADLVVLDKNLFTIPTEEIKETKVKLTMMDGDIVYSRK